jgi:hypothetical protein
MVVATPASLELGLALAGAVNRLIEAGLAAKGLDQFTHLPGHAMRWITAAWT